MIKKSVFEEEIVASMHREMVKQASHRDLDFIPQAVDYLHSAADIFEDMGMRKNADAVISILEKIADEHSKDPGLPHNGHTKGLTPERMTKNLERHGWVFNLAEDGQMSVGDDDLEVFDQGEASDDEMNDFEDEKD